MFDMHSESPSYNNADLLAVVLIGVLGGLFGSLYNYLVDKVLRTYTVINEYVLLFLCTCFCLAKTSVPF